MNNNKNSYNKIVEEWDKARKEGSISSLLKKFVNSLKPHDKVLDVGCGTGYPITKYLSDYGLEVTAIDNAHEMVKKAKKLKLSNVSFFEVDFFNFKPTDKYEGIVAFDSFFHFDKHRQPDIYPKIANMLKLNGYLLFTHGKEDGEITGEMFGEKFYYSSLATNKVVGLLESYGFEIIDLIEDYKENNDERELIVLAKKVDCIR